MPHLELSEAAMKIAQEEARIAGIDAGALIEKILYEAWERREVNKGLESVKAGRLTRHNGMEEILEMAKAKAKDRQKTESA